MRLFLILVISISFLKCERGHNIHPDIENNRHPAGAERVDFTNDTVAKSVYPNGKIKDCLVTKDSGLCKKLYVSFYQNGNVLETGCQGYVQNKDVSTGTPVGTWFYYDLYRRLDSTIFYGNENFGKDFIKKKFFYKTGSLKEVRQFNNYILYENEVDSIGLWKYYDSTGNLIKVIDHKNRVKGQGS